MKGKVHLVGAGPGDPELLTLKAMKLLREADVVLHDDLVAPAILSLAPPAARIVNVGKRCGRKSITQEEINSLMISYARRGLTVVRLKGGDPLVFGRAGEEMEALRRAAIDFDVVPGVTAALSAAAAAKVPLTDRHTASALTMITGHPTAGRIGGDWPPVISGGRCNSTLLVYMPGAEYAQLRNRLRAAGLSGQTPCLIVSAASTEESQMYRTTVGRLAEAPLLPQPRLLIIGEVIELAANESNATDNGPLADAAETGGPDAWCQRPFLSIPNELDSGRWKAGLLPKD